jgi:predicted O-methyltransferase YrrM
VNPPGEMVLARDSAAARGLRLAASRIRPLKESAALRTLLAGANRKRRSGWKQLFFQGGKPLPCFLKEDLTPSDPWLTSPDYYPAYQALFQTLAAGMKRVRMLEIGVRTGYVAAVFAHAVKTPALYVGVDPNRYVANGLELAGATLRVLRQKFPDYDGVLIEGYSWEERIHQTLRDSGPFDMIHIDGHHVLDVKMHDIALARDLVVPGGFVLVDDLDHMDCVQDAVRRAMSLRLFRQYCRFDTYRGLAILRA